MIRFYYHPTPNPLKVALLLEESGIEYEVVATDTRKGEQHTPAFLAINPNGKTPAIVDLGAGPGGADVPVFDSNAILMYLAEKTGRFLPEATPAGRAGLLSWMMFVASGIGPYSGQSVHFQRFAPEPKDYALRRYAFEAERHWGVLNARLADRRYVLGDSYTIVDMAVWGWCNFAHIVLGAEKWAEMTHVNRLFSEINARPAAQRASDLKNRHAFKAEMDDEARKIMFPFLRD